MELVIVFIIGLGAGMVLMWFFAKREANVAQQVYQQNIAMRQQETEKLVGNLKESFVALSSQALSHNSEEFLRLADLALSRQLQSGEKNLDGKKALIDQSLQSMKAEMQKMQQIVSLFEKDRVEKFGQLSHQLQRTAEQTAKLQEVTNILKNTISNTKVRGQWGERMAEDILRMAGMAENVNFLKQQTVQGARSRPDFTFLLPRGQKVNMDVKFPFNNYLKYLETEIEGEKRRFKDAFLKDVKQRIKEVTGKSYINPQEHTVDYVLVFIPNEQVYAFIHENEPMLIDEAIKQKVILCSPFTLYAILSVVRQAVENFSLEQTASDMLAFMREFRNQWLKFAEGMDKLGKKIEDAQKEFHQLSTTRKRQLDKSLNRIDNIDTAEKSSASPHNSTPKLFPD